MLFRGGEHVPLPPKAVDLLLALIHGAPPGALRRSSDHRETGTPSGRKTPARWRRDETNCASCVPELRCLIEAWLHPCYWNCSQTCFSASWIGRQASSIAIHRSSERGVDPAWLMKLCSLKV